MGRSTTWDIIFVEGQGIKECESVNVFGWLARFVKIGRLEKAKDLRIGVVRNCLGMK